MNVIVGHTNTDLDCIGSMALARRLFPDHRPVRSHLIHPVARNVYNLFEKHLSFLPLEDLRGQTVEPGQPGKHLVVVDTRSRARIREFLEQVNHTGAPVIMKGRRAGAMGAPVTAYMTRPVHTCSPSATVSELERIMYEKGVGHLPLVASGRLAGIVTRADLLRFLDDGRARNREVLARLSGLTGQG